MATPYAHTLGGVFRKMKLSVSGTKEARRYAARKLQAQQRVQIRRERLD